MQPILFHTADRPFILKNKKLLKAFIKTVFEHEGKKVGRINYIFCSDDYLLQINKEYLQHNFYTDIVTFDLSEGSSIIGEIYVSIDRVKDNALQQGNSFRIEALRVLFHGALHLCGYNDKKKSEITKMREKEDYYLTLFEQKYP